MLLLLVPGILSAQSTAENYIRGRRVLNEENTSWMDRTVYYDGLGRPYQTLEQTCRDGSLTGKNLINLLEYDANGRQTNQWLPIQAGATDYLPLADFKASAAGQYGNAACPYTQSVYEASALNRVIEEYGPGEAWREGGHAVRTDYLTNGTDFPLSCKDYSVSGEGTLATGGIRTAGTLKVTRVTDAIPSWTNWGRYFWKEGWTGTTPLIPITCTTITETCSTYSNPLTKIAVTCPGTPSAIRTTIANAASNGRRRERNRWCTSTTRRTG